MLQNAQTLRECDLTNRTASLRAAEAQKERPPKRKYILTRNRICVTNNFALQSATPKDGRR